MFNNLTRKYRHTSRASEEKSCNMWGHVKTWRKLCQEHVDEMTRHCNRKSSNAKKTKTRQKGLRSGPENTITCVTDQMICWGVIKCRQAWMKPWTPHRNMWMAVSNLGGCCPFPPCLFLELLLVWTLTQEGIAVVKRLVRDMPTRCEGMCQEDVYEMIANGNQTSVNAKNMEKR